MNNVKENGLQLCLTENKMEQRYVKWRINWP